MDIADYMNELLAASNTSEDDFLEGYYGFIRLLGHKPYNDDTSSMAPMLRVAEALAELDAKREKCDVTDFPQRGYSRALRQAIENDDWLLQVEVLKSLGDLYLERGKKTGDERNVCFAINLYLNALSHCRDNFCKIALYHRVSHATKYITHPPLPYTAQYHLWHRDLDKDRSSCMPWVEGRTLDDLDPQKLFVEVGTWLFKTTMGKDIVAERYGDVSEYSNTYLQSVKGLFEDLFQQMQGGCDEDALGEIFTANLFRTIMNRDVSGGSNTCILRVARMLEDLDRQRRQGCDEDALIEGYTATMVRAIMYTDSVAELEAIKSIGDIYLERGRVQKNTEDLSKALALYNSALKINVNEASNVALQHRIEYARKVLRGAEKLTRLQNKKVKKYKETRSYVELLLAADTVLQNGDLDASEIHFASALQQIHDRESPRLREEGECLRKLGDVYVRRGEQTKDGQDFAKATALYNAALARNGDERLLIDSIKEAERLFLYHTVGIDCKPSPYETDIQHKTRLEEFRTVVKDRLESIHKNHNPYQYDEDDPVLKKVENKRAEAIKGLFKDISEQRKDFIKDLVEECIETIGPPPCQYAMVGLGSQATELVTPYSDLEFAILIEENKDTPEKKEYFVNLTCYLYIKIINLGETILPAVAIKSLNDFHSEDPADRWFYDSVTPRGFAFDGAMPWASKTPFGREKTRSKPAVSLIQTPAGMAEFQRHDIALAHGYHLSSILRYVSYLTGDQTLVDDYVARVILELSTFDDQHKTTAAVGFAQVSLNLATQEPSWGQGITDMPLDVKREIYRFPAVTVLNLALLRNVYETSIWDTIKEMEEAGVVTSEDAHHLLVLVSISGELRLRTYLELEGQKENLSGLMAMQKQGDSGDELLKSVFYVPDQKMLFRYFYSVRPLKKYIKGVTPFIAELDTSQLGRETFYDASPLVKANIHQGLLQFNAAISCLEGALEELDEENVDGTRLPGQRKTVDNLHLKSSLLGQQAECYFGLVDHRKAIRRWEEQLSVQQQIHEYDSTSIVRTYQNLAKSWARIGNEEKFLAYFKHAAALTYKNPVDPEIAYSLPGLTEYIECDYKAKTILNSINEAKLNNTLRTEPKENSARPDVAVQLLNLGKRFNNLGDYTKAITYTEESLKMMKTIYGQDTAHPLIAAALTNLGRSLCEGRDDHVKAARCYEEAYDINKLVDTPHPATVRILNSLGVEWMHLGDHQKSHSCLEKALHMAKTIHGNEACYPDIAHALNNVGVLWYISGDNEKALEFFEQSLKMFQTLHGPEHHNTAFVLRNVGITWGKSGNNVKAISYYEEALKMMEEVWGKGAAHANIAKVLGSLGSACFKAREYTKSLSYYERALEVHKAKHGHDAAHPSIVESLTKLWMVSKVLGDHTKANQFFEEAFIMAKTIHGNNETREGNNVLGIVGVFNLFGHLCNAVNDSEKLLVLCNQALKMSQEHYGPASLHPETALYLFCMGGALEESGDHFDAISFYEEALKMSGEILGTAYTENALIAPVLSIIASACRNAKEYTKSLQYYERVLKIYRSVHGHDAAHPCIAASLSDLAAVYEDLGDHTKAIKFFEDALNMLKIIHGGNGTREEEEPCHPDIDCVLTNLGELWLTVGDNDKARVFFEQSLKMCQKLYGPTTPHHHTAISLYNMGIVLENSGDNVKAISLYEEELKMLEEIFGKSTKHPDIVKVLARLGSACRKAGKYTKSLRYYQLALKSNKAIHGQLAAHPDIADSLCDFAMAYGNLGNHTKAIRLYEEALNMLKVIHGGREAYERDEVNHPKIAGVLNSLGCHRLNLGDNEKARAFFEQALRIRQELHGPTIPHQDTAMLLENVGIALEKSGDNVKAISYYEEALKMMEEVWGKSTEHANIAKVLCNLGSAYRKAGEYTNSLQCYERAMEMYKVIHGQEAAHTSIANSLWNLAAVYDDLKNYAKAVQLCEEALNMLKVIHGGKETNGEDGACHPDIAMGFRNLAIAFRKAGEYTNSLQYFQRALEMNKSVHGQDAAHPDIAESLSNVATVYKDLGNYTKAIPLYEDALNMFKNIYSANETREGEEPCHSDIAGVLTCLGDLWLTVGDNEKARAFFEPALKMYQDLYGPTTPDHNTAIALSNMGEVLEKFGDYFEAISFYEDSLKMLEKVLGKSTEHPHMALMLGNLGSAYHKAGEHRKSLQYCEKALDMIKSLHGQDAVDPIIADTLRNIAAVYEDLGDNTKAIQLYQDALNRVKTIHGPNNPHHNTAISLHKLGEALEKSGDIYRAVSLYEEALKMMEEVWDKITEHLHMAEVLVNLGSAYRKVEEHTKSIECYQRALEINMETLEKKKSIHGKDAVHPSIAKSLSNLAKVYGHVGDHTKAIQLYEEALNMLKAIHGADETHGQEEPNHPHIAGVLLSLGELWFTVGDNEKARVFFEQALKMYKELYGPTTPHLDTAKSLANVGVALGKSGENCKAISYYEESLKMLEEVLINKDHPRIAWLLSNLGSACRKTGEHTKSLRYYERALGTNKTIHGQDVTHPSIAKSLRNLAKAHEHIGDQTKAIQLYEEALKMTKAIHGGKEPHHPDIARVLSHLGRLSYNVGDNEKALVFFEQEMKMKRELYGHTTPHRRKARSLTNLAVALEKSGYFSKAIGCYEEALTMLEEVIDKGTAHPDIAWVLGNLASACHKAGEHTKSLQYCEKALEVIERFRAENVVHLNIAASLREVAAVYEDLENYRKAIQLYGDALNMLKVIHGGNRTHGDEARHPSIAHVLRKLGCLWYKVGNNEKARAFFEQALKMNRQLYGPTTPHHDTAVSLGNMGAVLEESGDINKAISLYEEALAMLEVVVGNKKGHPDMVRLVGNLGRACHKTLEYTKSLQCYERVLDINKGIHGEEAAHPSIVNSLSSLAAVYEDFGDHTKAIQLYKDALRRVQTVQGENKKHPDVIKLLNNLETAYNKAGDQEKANLYRDQAHALKKATEEEETHLGDTDSTDHKE